MNLLSAKNLAHTFDYELFSDVSLDLNEGESIAIIGVSGSGKSTLLNILSTLLKPDEGSVSIFGEDVSGMSKKRLSQIKRDEIGLVFQSHYLFKGFTCLENLEVAAILSNQDIDENLLKRLKIDEAVNQKVTELSGGQQQRVSIARVLTKQPRLLFVDEPTGNLDKLTANEVMDIFFEYIAKHSAGMILVTHDEELAYKCHKVYKLINKELKVLK
ncbi:MAG: ABC transporter ATP-binding protein [Sulfurimonas sp. RIFCSPHIGHO2_12_FULL_36_9]|jgi:putative ABC transport system ATP-binding protein|uniref:ABC transporter ATP-binding protein n=1 Tax=unclassified Sulfurimonas TaxID=2623549 RepID=UPI0008CA8607|nr:MULTISPECIES: ABC transporter ATP-binding protein [unclassified Sulfurimonas]OHD98129.1 MAG: ABC transporter ATP-binding protein [Sulfurimonas sp. RIFCSPLOWO2_02_FULL_36_28]OHD98893.1 MAG: ABC transporter ATP-binding protein [Sulfurimonas sp. RIFCSPHIGHO2_12_FULL_36_9]OHE01272.1 MAG: ABC transporter ATP-binding protein [Sulfurimonas sp. RIFCSPLOWO2_12_36_12]OHE02429.1 MAG: ABC transporter ATP-binding protein [Sulfurimonas sp. RIFCSPLOWO2_12_FULL_36_74]